MDFRLLWHRIRNLDDRQHGMALQELIGFATLTAGIAASYIKTQTDVARLKAEMRATQQREQEVAHLIRNLTTCVNRIEKALVKAGLIDIE